LKASFCWIWKHPFAVFESILLLNLKASFFPTEQEAMLV
jgi:hypothetical protein